MNLADLIASGLATVKLDDIVRTRADDDYVLDISRCVAFEQAAAGTIPTIRVGRRLLVPVPRLLTMLGIPLPEEWQPAGALAARCQCAESGTDSGELGSTCPKVGR